MVWRFRNDGDLKVLDGGTELVGRYAVVNGKTVEFRMPTVVGGTDVSRWGIAFSGDRMTATQGTTVLSFSKAK